MGNTASIDYLSKIAKTLRTESGKYVVLATPTKTVRYSPVQSTTVKKVK